MTGTALPTSRAQGAGAANALPIPGAAGGPAAMGTTAAPPPPPALHTVAGAPAWHSPIARGPPTPRLPPIPHVAVGWSVPRLPSASWSWPAVVKPHQGAARFQRPPSSWGWEAREGGGGVRVQGPARGQAPACTWGDGDCKVLQQHAAQWAGSSGAGSRAERLTALDPPLRAGRPGCSRYQSGTPGLCWWRPARHAGAVPAFQSEVPVCSALGATNRLSNGRQSKKLLRMR